jgi:hypothetical protein
MASTKTRRKAAPVNRKYLYLRADAPAADLTMVSFSYVFVSAADEEAAYAAGHKETENNHSGIAWDGYRFLNDYVIELP